MARANIDCGSYPSKAESVPETADELDYAVRMAAFAFLDEKRAEDSEETLPFQLLREGFVFRGTRVPLLGPQGIFKPAILPEMPLTITTAPHDPYGDTMDSNNTLHYRYMGNNPMHHVNVGLRKAMVRQAPLVYFRGIVKGRYLPEWPVFVVGDDFSSLTFHVSIDDHAMLGESPSMPVHEAAETRRAYATVLARQRLHQARFRERVLNAYRECCAICRLRHRELLDATHILPDKHPRGEPIVSNGLSLCKLHHAAYDRHILGIRPDLQIDVRLDILEEVDGPMLRHGLQGFQDQRLVVPHRAVDRPDPEFLAIRYEQFRRAG